MSYRGPNTGKTIGATAFCPGMASLVRVTEEYPRCVVVPGDAITIDNGYIHTDSVDSCWGEGIA